MDKGYAFFFLGYCVLTVDACISGGDFYCAQIWYFWFAIFWICLFLLVGAIVITNLCTKRKRRVSQSCFPSTVNRKNSIITASKSNQAQGIINVRARQGSMASINRGEADQSTTPGPFENGSDTAILSPVKEEPTDKEPTYKEPTYKEPTDKAAPAKENSDIKNIPNHRHHP